MKRFVCILLAALLFCLSAAALAENGADLAAVGLFEHDWVNEKDQDDSVFIGQEDGEWFVLAVRYGEGDEMLGVEFEKCLFDEAQNAIVCQGGTLSSGGFLNEENEEDEEEQEAEADVEILATGFGAVLTVDENGLLHWTGSGDAWEDRTYISDDAEDDGLFVGEWVSGESWISVTLRRGVYDVLVVVEVSEDEAHIWEYTCALDESGALVGTGVKTVEISDDAIDEVTETVIFDDGQAVFTLDGDTLLWNDAKEDAGQGMVFEHFVDDGNEED